MKISLEFDPKGPINNIPALVQGMACHLLELSHYLEQLLIVNWTLGNKFHWNLKQHKKPRIQENGYWYKNIICLSSNSIPFLIDFRADSRFVPSQWETVLLCNDTSHWLGTNLESALEFISMFDDPGIISLWFIFDGGDDGGLGFFLQFLALHLTSIIMDVIFLCLFTNNPKSKNLVVTLWTLAVVTYSCHLQFSTTYGHLFCCSNSWPLVSCK